MSSQYDLNSIRDLVVHLETLVQLLYGTESQKGMLAELQEMVVACDKHGQPWLGGTRIGALDAYSLTLTRWGTIAGITPEAHPDLTMRLRNVDLPWKMRPEAMCSQWQNLLSN